MNWVFQTLAYPFLTVQRRLECMSLLGVSLLRNDEYKGFLDAVKRIYREEGALAFYRGYLAYMLAVSHHYWGFYDNDCIDNDMDEFPALRY